MGQNRNEAASSTPSRRTATEYGPMQPREIPRALYEEMLDHRLAGGQGFVLEHKFFPFGVQISHREVHCHRLNVTHSQVGFEGAIGIEYGEADTLFLWGEIPTRHHLHRRGTVGTILTITAVPVREEIDRQSPFRLLARSAEPFLIDRSEGSLAARMLHRASEMARDPGYMNRPYWMNA